MTSYLIKNITDILETSEKIHLLFKSQKYYTENRTHII